MSDIFSNTHNALVQIREELIRVCDFDVLDQVEVSNNWGAFEDDRNSAFLQFHEDNDEWDPPEGYHGSPGGYNSFLAVELESFLATLEPRSIKDVYQLFEVIHEFRDPRDQD